MSHMSSKAATAACNIAARLVLLVSSVAASPATPNAKRGSNRLPGLGRSTVWTTSGNRSTCPASRQGEPPEGSRRLCEFILRREQIGHSRNCRLSPHFLPQLVQRRIGRACRPAAANVSRVGGSVDVPGYGDYRNRTGRRRARCGSNAGTAARPLSSTEYRPDSRSTPVSFRRAARAQH